MRQVELRRPRVFSVMVTNSRSTWGKVTARQVALPSRTRKDRVGILLSEATYVRSEGKATPTRSVRKVTYLPRLRRLTEGAHASGPIAGQLCHRDPQTFWSVSGLPLMASSVTRFGDNVTWAIRREDIERIVSEYAHVSVRT